MSVETRCGFRRTRMRDRRCRVVTIRLSDAELDSVTRAAESSQLAIGAYAARAAVMQSRGLQTDEAGDLRKLHAELSQAWTAISRVGANVNQLAKVANSTGDIDHARLGQTLSFVRRALARVEEMCLQIGSRLP